MSPQNGSGDSPEPVDVDDLTPEEGIALAKMELVELPLEDFVGTSTMWAVNHFVLWPLGLTMAVDVDEDTSDVSNLRVMQWAYPDDEKIETITADEKDNQDAYDTWLAFVRDRVLSMKPDEREIMLRLFVARKMADPFTLMTVAP